MNLRSVWEWLSDLPQRCGCNPQWSYWRYFWCRQAYHLLGGAIIAGVGVLIGLIGSQTRIYVLAAFAAITGFLVIRGETEDQTEGQGRFKTLIDICAWGVGFALTVGLTSCGIDPVVNPVIQITPETAISLEAAGCTCTSLPVGSYVLVPYIDLP